MPAPLAHISGLLNGVLVPGACRHAHVLMARWDPEHALDAHRARAGHVHGRAADVLRRLMAAPGFRAERVAILRLVSSGGAGVTPAFVEEATERARRAGEAHVRVDRGADGHDQHVRDDPVSAPRDDRRPTRSVQCELRIGADGELWCAGPSCFVGLPRPPTRPRAAVDRDGWFRTGDLATVDGDGWLTIVGRKKDVIIRGGENIAAAEVERRARGPSRRSRQAVAVGYPDERLGERVCAFVVSGRALRPRGVPGVVPGPGRRPVQDPRAGGARRRAPGARRRQGRPHHPAHPGRRAALGVT